MSPRKKTTDIESPAEFTVEAKSTKKTALKKTHAKTANKTELSKTTEKSEKSATIEKPIKNRKSGKQEEPPSKDTILQADQLTLHAQKILQAITEKKVVEFIFKDPESNAPRNFEPRSLSFDSLEQAWHVWGWDRRYNADRHHCLDSLAKITLLDGVGRSAQGPYPDNTPPNHIGGWQGGEQISVRAVLLKQSAYYVRQAPNPFPGFTITEVGDGKVQVSFTATDFRAIARWCMQFGDGIQVIEPSRLIDRLKQVGHAWVAMTQSTPVQPQPENRDISPKIQPKAQKKIKEEQDISQPDGDVSTKQSKKKYVQREKNEDVGSKANPSSQRVEIRVERL